MKTCNYGHGEYWQQQCPACARQWKKNSAVDKEKNLARMARYRASNKDKIAARGSVRYYLEPKPCKICGDKAEAHHEDYDKPLEVQWLCKVHHREAHTL